MKKKLALVFMIMLLIFPNYLVFAQQQTNESNRSSNAAYMNTHVASKDEVVYGRLSATGDVNELYVVNMLNVTAPGTVVDYGNYSSVRNLTDLTDIELMNDQVQFQASPGWFYYQGNIKDLVLPWDIDISYKLDGEEISPNDLAGKEGRLLLTIRTVKNATVNPVFYENYTLQISLSFDTHTMNNIEAPNATIVNVGKKRQFTYTVMPDSEGNIVLLADIVDFEMDGIDISAIPITMAIDSPNMNDMTEEMKSLSDAIAKLNTGIIDLRKGVSELNNGVQELNSGSNEYHSGISELSNASTEVIDSSESINEALITLAKELNSSPEEIEQGDLSQLLNGLAEMAEGLKDISEGLSMLNDNFAMAYNTLDNAMNGIPASALTDADVQQLYASGVNRSIIDHMLEVYVAAQTAKGTYDNLKQVFTMVETTLDSSSEALSDISNQLFMIVTELSSNLDGLKALDELKNGVALLANNYSQFHSGLQSYTDSISQLAAAYSDIDSGIFQVSQGTDELENGVGELADGIQELADATRDLPNKMQEEINVMLDEYSKADFDPVSFVSPKNNNINSVQFILKTEEIKVKQEDIISDGEEEQPGFWQRLWRLFSFILPKNNL